MKKQIVDFLKKNLILTVVAFVLLISLPIAALADATLTVPGLSLSGDWNVVSGSTNSFEKSVTTTSCDAVVSTLTISAAAEKTGTLEFSVTTECIEGTAGSVEVKHGSSELTPSDGKYTVPGFSAANSITIKVSTAQKKNSTQKATVSNIVFTEDVTVSVQFAADPMGVMTYTVKGGQSIATPVIQTTNTTISYAITGMTDSNYVLAGWHWTDGENEGYYSVGGTAQRDGATGTVPVKGAYTLTPVVAYGSTTAAPFKANNEYWWTWETAMSAALASTDKIVTQLVDYTLPVSLNQNGLAANGKYVAYDANAKRMTYTIPSGAKVLVPYNAKDTGDFDEKPTMRNPGTVNSISGFLNEPIVARDPSVYDSYSSTIKRLVNNNGGLDEFAKGMYAYRKLTVPANTTIDVNGDLNVNSRVFVMAHHETGTPASTHGQIVLEAATSVINVNNGGQLFCYGFITGEGAVNNSGNVYELLQIVDWRGGTPALSWQSSGTTNFLFSQYYVQNIECSYVINKGSTSYAVASLSVSNALMQKSLPFVGPGEDAFLQLSTEKITRAYVPSTERIQYTVEGNLSMNSITIPYNNSVSFSSKDYILPLQNNILINIVSGTTTLTSAIKMLPNSEITVGEKANLIVAEDAALYLYDKYDWEITTNATKPYYSFWQSTNTQCDGSKELYDNYAVKLKTVRYSPTRGKPTKTPAEVSAVLTVNGTLIAYDNIFTSEQTGAIILKDNNGADANYDESSSVDSNKVIRGTGTIVNNANSGESTWAKAKLMESPQLGHTSNAKVSHVTIATLPGVGRIVGLTDGTTYQSFGIGTYHSCGTDIWYNYKVTSPNVDLITVTSMLAADSNANDDVVGYVSYYTDADEKNVQSAFTFTVPEGYRVFAQMGEAEVVELEATDGVYSLTNVTADTVIVVGTLVAEVVSGEKVTVFTALQDAVDAAKKGDKVVLLVDLIEEKALDAAITVAEGQDITIDLNGHSVTASQFINIPAGATVDITSSAETDGSITKGTITGTLVSSNTNNEVASPGSTPGVIINRGNLTVSNVSIIQTTGTSCAGIFNFAAGVIDSIENVVIDVGIAELSYGIVTYGKIDVIANTNITAHRGICVYDNANAQITTIGPAKKPVTITAVQYGIHVQAAKNIAKQSRIETVGEVEITTNRDSGTTELTGDAEHLKVNAAIYLYSGLGIGNIGIDGGTTTLNGEVGIYASRAPVGIIGVEGSTVNIDARLTGIFGYGAKSIFGTIGVSGSQVKIDSEANGIHVYYGGSVATIGEKLGTDVKAEATVVINAANYGINVHAPNANSTTSIDVIGSVKVTNSVRGISVYGGGTETRIAQINTIGMQGCDTIIEGDYGIYVIHTGSKINAIGAAGGNVTIKGNEDIAFRIGKGAVGAIGATGGKVTIQSKTSDAIYITDSATIDTIGVANAANTCVEIIGAKRAVLNGSGCTISKITDGLLAVTTANNRCLQNNGTIEELSGGCFSSAKGTASYAVYNNTSVEGASITYPDGMGLSSYTVPVKTSSDETYECYYITTKAMDGKVILDAISLDIESEIQFNLKFLIPSNIRAEGGQITVTEEKNAIEPEKTQTVNLTNLTTTDHQGRLVFTQGIAAGEMTGNVTVTILNAKDEPIAIYDTKGVEISPNGTLVRTVQDYAKLAFGSDKTELKDMCAAMLIFGEHAQKFYGTHTDRLASSILTEYLIDAPDINQIDVAALPEVEHSGYDIGIKVSSQQVDLDSDVKLRVFFTLTDAEAWDDYTIKLTRPAGNGTTEATQTWELEIGERVGAESTESYYYVEFAVPPAYWNNNYVITVTPEVLPEGETVEQNTYTVTTSVMAWVKDCIETNTNDNEVNMAKAMYYYSDLADAYFAAKAAVNQ